MAEGAAKQHARKVGEAQQPPHEAIVVIEGHRHQMGVGVAQPFFDGLLFFRRILTAGENEREGLIDGLAGDEDGL